MVLARVAAVGRWALLAWQRSLQLRVVATTLALSLAVVSLLGAALLRQVADGLLDTRVDAAMADAGAGVSSAQRQLSAADVVDAGDVPQLLTQLVQDLANRGGPARLYDVVLTAPTGGTSSPAARSTRVSGGVDPDSVPDALRAAVRSETALFRTFTTIRSTERSIEPQPGLVVGSQVFVPGAGLYELYYLFPLSEQERALELIGRAVATVGALLALLLGAIAWVVVRQVVSPVRVAARTAERFSAGRLEERMVVHGKDDLTRLATSLNAMAASLQRQIAQLEELSRVQRRFVSDVSHELRTPLTTVRMAADVLHEARAGFDPATRRAAELLQEQLDRFESLLTDLLEISRFDAGAAVLDLESVDLRDLVQRVASGAAPVASHTGSALVLDLPSTPCSAEVDPRRIERVVRNLIDNALEHGEGRPVLVRVAADADGVAVAVRDHGVGLKPGESSLVFNRFWRGDPARARTIGGTGLGLSIALEDARLHDGWLQAWGEPGHGALFRLTVPRRAGEELVASPIPLVPADETSQVSRVG